MNCLPIIVKRTTCLLGLILTVVTTGSIAQSNQLTDSSKTSKAAHQPLKINLLPPMQQMITKMKKAKVTGDPDIDFANQARLHTQGTQDLLKAILKAQSDSTLTQTAKTMLATIVTDLTTLGNLRSTLKPTRPNSAFAKQQGRVIAAMSEKIKQSASSYKLTQNPDENIIILLTDQRQDAINLATSYLEFGRNVELRNFAQQLVEKAKLDLDIIKNVRSASK